MLSSRSPMRLRPSGNRGKQRRNRTCRVSAGTDAGLGVPPFQMRSQMPQLPAHYEPLLLTFHEPKLVDDATIIGSDCGTRLELVSEAVFSVDPDGRLPRRFVNSSRAAFASSIEAHRAYCSAITDALSLAEEDHAVESFAAALVDIDPAALAEPENWWSVVVEQLRDGLL